MNNTTELAKIILEKNDGLASLVSDAAAFTLEDVAAFAKEKNLGWNKKYEQIFAGTIAKKYAKDNRLLGMSSSLLYLISFQVGIGNDQKTLYIIPHKKNESTEEEHRLFCLDLYYAIQRVTKYIPTLSKVYPLESSASIMSSAWKNVDELENGPVVRGRSAGDDSE